jgi:hypothetical protein
MTVQAVLRRGSAADLASLEPLWVSVHRRHAEAMPELAPYVDDQQTWAARSAPSVERHLLLQTRPEPLTHAEPGRQARCFLMDAPPYLGASPRRYS